MGYQNLLLEIGEDHVGVITLNRPERLNTFDTPTARELEAALWEMEAEANVRVIILAGAGKAFCAGIDLKEMEGKSAHELKEWVEEMERPLIAISRLKKPVIAQVQGTAAANGGGLVAAADLAVAAEDARIGFTAVKVGLFCLGPAVPLMRVVGRKRAMELLMFGELITAGEALAMGLVNKVVPADKLAEQTRRWASRLARLSPLAVQIGKQALYAAADQEYQKAFLYMNEAFARLCTTEDAKEGVKAFLEKRSPTWRGR
jgi:enoyl-CoA hydratase/carnithine racemase